VPHKNGSRRVATHVINELDPSTHYRSSIRRMEPPFEPVDRLTFPAQPMDAGTISGYVHLDIRRAHDEIIEEVVVDPVSNVTSYEYEFDLKDEPLEGKPPWISFHFNFILNMSTEPGSSNM